MSSWAEWRDNAVTSEQEAFAEWVEAVHPEWITTMAQADAVYDAPDTTFWGISKVSIVLPVDLAPETPKCSFLEDWFAFQDAERADAAIQSYPGVWPPPRMPKFPGIK
jgi:hypothetical protein